MTEYNVHEHRVIATHRIISRYLNDHDTLFGGRMLELADAEPAILVSRLSRRNLATACLEDAQFHHPLVLHDTFTLTGTLTGLGTRSAEVFVKAIGENLRTGEQFLAFTSFNTYVVPDKDFAFPDLTLVAETAEEQYLLDTYPARVAKRKAARQNKDGLVSHLSLES